MHAGAHDFLRIGAEEIHDHRFARFGGLGEHALGNRGRRRLRDQHDDLRDRVGGKIFQGLQHGNAADFLVQVAPAGTDRLRDAGAQPVCEHGDLLQSGARCRHHADRPTPDHVGERERGAVDDGGTAVRPHDDQILLARELLEREFLLHRHVVAEQHDVEAEAQRLHRFGAGVVARRGDQRHVRLAGELQRHLDAARTQRRARLATIVFGLARQVLDCFVDRRGQRRLFSLHHDQQVARARARRIHAQAGFGKQRQVVLGGHHRGRLLDARQFAEQRGELHQRHRIAVLARDDFYHCRAQFFSSRCITPRRQCTRRRIAFPAGRARSRTTSRTAHPRPSCARSPMRARRQR